MENTASIQEVAPPPNVIDSTLDTNSSGGGRVAPEPVEAKPDAPRKPESVSDSLTAAAKEIDAEKAKAPVADDDKDNPAKVEPAKQESPKNDKIQPAKADGEAAQAEEVTKRGPEPREIIEAPARLLPRSKELWKNVPHELRSDLRRIEQEASQEIEKHREAAQFREELKDYDDMARKHGTSVKAALDNYVGIEKKFAEEPSQGFRQLLSNLQMQPKDAISHILRAFNVTPQALAEHIARAPHEYTALARQGAPQQSQQAVPDPRYQQLEEQVNSLKQQQETAHTQAVFQNEILPFWQENPEAKAHWPALEEVLLSGIIDKLHGSGLSPRDKLEVALRMVAPNAASATVRQPSHEQPAPVGDLRGDNKSIKSSLGTVSDVEQPQKKLSTRDLLEDELRKMQRRA